MNELFASTLARLLAEVVSFKYVAQASHWNVRGINFQQFHELFQEIYEDAEGSVDALGENLRKINYQTPSTLVELLSLVEQPAIVDATEPVALSANLYQMNEYIRECLIGAMIVADEAGEQGIYNFLADRFDKHSKWQWQLRMVIGDGIADTYAIDVKGITDSFLA